MGSIAGTMYTFFQNSKTEGAYMLLFALSIVILYFTNRERDRFYTVYSALLLLGVVCNPVTVWILSLIFPVLKNYSPMAGLIPILLYIPYGIVELLYIIKSVKTQRIVAILLFLYVSICGNFIGAFEGNTRTQTNYYDAGKREVVEFLEANTKSMALADDSLLSFISSYGDSVPLLYGHDLLHADSDLGIIDGYDYEIFDIQRMMWAPQIYLDDIAKVAKSRGCDIIVVKNFEGAKSHTGVYRLALSTPDYIVYRSIG